MAEEAVAANTEEELINNHQATAEKMQNIGRIHDEFEDKLSEATEFIEQSDDIISNLKNNQTNANSELEALKAIIVGLKKSEQEVQGRIEDVSGLVEKLENIRSESESARESVSGDIQAICDSKEDFENKKIQAQETLDKLNEDYEEISNTLNSVQKDHSRVSQFASELLDDRVDTEGNSIPSIKAKISKVQDESSKELASIKNLHLTLQEDFDELKTELKNKIESLLPGATVAGLSFAYSDAKAIYGAIPVNSDKDGNVTKKRAAWHYFVQAVKVGINYVLFIAPLCFISWFLWEWVSSNMTLSAQNIELKNHADPLFFIFRLLISAPLGLISYFGYSSIQLNRRLYEEYNHKQRVMQVYHGFEREISELEDPELKRALLGIMLNVVNYKPSTSMAEHQKMPDVVESLKGLIGSVNPLKPKETQ